MTTSCTHPDTVPVETVERPLNDPHTAPVITVVARLCLGCDSQLPAYWGCEDCEWEDLELERAFCEPVARGGPCVVPSLPHPRRRLMSMTKVTLTANESYPDYAVCERENEGHGDFAVDATDEQLQRWAAAAEAYAVAQREMGDLYDAAEEAHRERAERAKAEREAAEKAEYERKRAEAEAARAEQMSREEAAWARVAASDGVVYDADGRPVGRLVRGRRNAGTVTRLEP